MTPSEPCIVCSGCDHLVPLRRTTQVGNRRSLRCPRCEMVREWLLSSGGELIDLGARHEQHAEELARLHDGRPLVVADILAAARRSH